MRLIRPRLYESCLTYCLNIKYGLQCKDTAKYDSEQHILSLVHYLYINKNDSLIKQNEIYYKGKCFEKYSEESYQRIH